jgi:hypothetical protein
MMLSETIFLVHLLILVLIVLLLANRPHHIVSEAALYRLYLS